MKARALICDDHEIFLEGLAALLGEDSSLEVVGKAHNGREAVAACRDLHPNLVLIDLSMPEMNGIDAIRLIRAENPRTGLICLSMHSEENLVAGALEAGADGYLLKDGGLEELLKAIRTVKSGQTYLCPSAAGTMVRMFRRDGHVTTAQPAFHSLTGREREVLQLIAEGYSTKEIADALHVSPKTVGTHREHLMGKLDIHSIAGLTRYALQQGLTPLEASPQ